MKNLTIILTVVLLAVLLSSSTRQFNSLERGSFINDTIKDSIKTPPIFPGCENELEENLSSCMIKSIRNDFTQLLSMNYDFDLLTDSLYQARIEFVIAKDSTIKLRNIYSSNNIFGSIIRKNFIIYQARKNDLKIIPAKDANGNSVSTRYYLPIKLIMN